MGVFPFMGGHSRVVVCDPSAVGSSRTNQVGDATPCSSTYVCLLGLAVFIDSRPLASLRNEGSITHLPEGLPPPLNDDLTETSGMERLADWFVAIN